MISITALEHSNILIARNLWVAKGSSSACTVQSFNEVCASEQTFHEQGLRIKESGLLYFKDADYPARYNSYEFESSEFASITLFGVHYLFEERSKYYDSDLEGRYEDLSDYQVILNRLDVLLESCTIQQTVQ